VVELAAHWSAASLAGLRGGASDAVGAVGTEATGGAGGLTVGDTGGGVAGVRTCAPAPGYRETGMDTVICWPLSS
jgi:hypothetical protein